MKITEIKAAPFFELLKMHDTTMWSIFAQMQNGVKQQLIFLDEDGKQLFSYILPETEEELKKDQEVFAKEYLAKLAASQN